MYNLIQKLKDNEWLAYGGWPLEMRTKAHGIGYSNFEVRSHGTMKWGFISGGFHDVLILRLRPDYEEKSGIEEWPVFEGRGDVRFKRNLADGDDKGLCIDVAPRNPDFIGFKYEDGKVGIKPRMYKSKTNNMNYCPLPIEWFEAGSVEVLTPTAVLFRSKK